MTVRAWMRPGSISCVQAATYQALRIHMAASRRAAVMLRHGDRLAQRAGRLALRGRPVESVLLAGRAQQSAGILRPAGLHRVELGVFELGVHDRQQRLDRAELVMADLARQHFLLAADKVETPLRAILDDGDWQAPALVADLDRRPVAVSDLYRVLGVPRRE